VYPSDMHAFDMLDPESEVSRQAIRTFVKDNDLKGKHIAAFACQSGSGAEKAFGKLKTAIGIDDLEAELVVIDPKTKASEENDRKIEAFCEKLR